MSRDPAGANYQQALDRYLAAQLSGDASVALGHLNELIDAGVSPSEIRTRIVREAQHEIGRLWQADRITVAQEHAATAVGQVALAHLFGRSHFAARRGVAITVACVPGELHDFPARLLADELEVAGFDVDFLGIDVPAAALLSHLERRHPRLLALSVTMLFNCAALRDVIRAVRAKWPVLPIAIGGSGLRETPDPLREFDADLCVAVPQHLITALTTMERRAHA